MADRQAEITAVVFCFVISSTLLARVHSSCVSFNAGLACLQSASPKAWHCKLFLTLFRHSQSDKAAASRSMTP